MDPIDQTFDRLRRSDIDEVDAATIRITEMYVDGKIDEKQYPTLYLSTIRDHGWSFDEFYAAQQQAGRRPGRPYI